MIKNVIIVCGAQKAYFHEKGSRYMGEKSEILKIRIIEYLKDLDRESNVVFFTREVHQVNDRFFQNSKTYGVVGSPDIEVPEVFKPYVKFIINTSRYSSFYMTPLESELSKIKPQKVFLIGVETHTTVLFTAEELRNRDYSVVSYEALLSSEEDFMHNLGINILCNTLSVDIL